MMASLNDNYFASELYELWQFIPKNKEDGGKSWSSPERKLIPSDPGTLEYLVKSVARKQSVEEQYQSLGKRRKRLIDELVAEHDQRDPRFEWSCVYIKVEQHKIRTPLFGIRYISVSMEVIVLRKPRESARPGTAAFDHADAKSPENPTGGNPAFEDMDRKAAKPQITGNLDPRPAGEQGHADLPPGDAGVPSTNPPMYIPAGQPAFHPFIQPQSHPQGDPPLHFPANQRVQSQAHPQVQHSTPGSNFPMPEASHNYTIGNGVNIGSAIGQNRKQTTHQPAMAPQLGTSSIDQRAAQHAGKVEYDSRRPSFADTSKPHALRTHISQHLAASPRRYGSIGTGHSSPGYNRPPLPPQQQPPLPPQLHTAASPTDSSLLARQHTSADIRQHGWPPSGISSFGNTAGTSSGPWPSSPHRIPTPSDQQVRDVLAQYAESSMPTSMNNAHGKQVRGAHSTNNLRQQQARKSMPAALSPEVIQGDVRRPHDRRPVYTPEDCSTMSDDECAFEDNGYSSESSTDSGAEESLLWQTSYLDPGMSQGGLVQQGHTVYPASTVGTLPFSSAHRKRENMRIEDIYHPRGHPVTIHGGRQDIQMHGPSEPRLHSKEAAFRLLQIEGQQQHIIDRLNRLELQSHRSDGLDRVAHEMALHGIESDMPVQGHRVLYQEPQSSYQRRLNYMPRDTMPYVYETYY